MHKLYWNTTINRLRLEKLTNTPLCGPLYTKFQTLLAVIKITIPPRSNKTEQSVWTGKGELS